MTTILEGEPVRYYGDRHSWNNGFRRRWFANGATDAAIINAARVGDLDTVLAHVRQMGGVTGGIGIAKSIIKAARKLTDDVPEHKIVRKNGRVTVCIAHIGWKFSGDRQVGIIEWLPVLSVQTGRP